MAAAALLVALVLTAIGVPRIMRLAEETRGAHDVVMAVDGLFSDLLNVETGQRGYLLTGEPAYLEPYRAAGVALTASIGAMAALRAVQAPGSPLGPLLGSLIEATEGTRRELDTTLRRHDEAGPDAALERVREGAGRRRMDQVRSLVAQIHRVADAAALRAGTAAEHLLAWGSMLVVGLLAIAFAAGLRGQRIGRARESEVAARTRAIVETAPLGIAMLDAGLRFLIVNESLAEASARPAAEHRSRRVNEVMPATIAPAVTALLQRAMAQPDAVQDAVIDTPGHHRSWQAFARADVERGTLILLLQDISTRRAAEAERVLLIHELNHRVKNVIATVQGIATQSWAGADGDGDLFVEMFGARLRSLARAHGLLTDAGWGHAGLAEVLRVALAPWIGPREGAVSVTGEAGATPQLSPPQVLGLALVLHELATNAVKYGALSEPDGTVAIDWRCEADGDVSLTWREAGGPPIVSPPDHEGFGSFLIGRAFGSDAAPGEVTREFLPDGLVARFRFRPEG